jgi:very-short-patch-repair endonuclease
MYLQQLFLTKFGYMPMRFDPMARCAWFHTFRKVYRRASATRWKLGEAEHAPSIFVHIDFCPADSSPQPGGPRTMWSKEEVWSGALPAGGTKQLGVGISEWLHGKDYKKLLAISRAGGPPSWDPTHRFAVWADAVKSAIAATTTANSAIAATTTANSAIAATTTTDKSSIAATTTANATTRTISRTSRTAYVPGVQRGMGSHTWFDQERFDWILENVALFHRYDRGVPHRHSERDENKTMGPALAIFSAAGWECTREQDIGKYRADLLIHRAKVVLECDEHGHAGYPSHKEEARTKFLETTTLFKEPRGYTIFRFNPDCDKVKLLEWIFMVLAELEVLGPVFASAADEKSLRHSFNKPYKRRPNSRTKASSKTGGNKENVAPASNKKMKL